MTIALIPQSSPSATSVTHPLPLAHRSSLAINPHDFIGVGDWLGGSPHWHWDAAAVQTVDQLFYRMPDRRSQSAAPASRLWAMLAGLGLRADHAGDKKERLRKLEHGITIRSALKPRKKIQ